MKQSYVGESGLHDRIFREMEAKYQKESREKQFAYGFAEFLRKKEIWIDPEDPRQGIRFIILIILQCR